MGYFGVSVIHQTDVDYGIFNVCMLPFCMHVCPHSDVIFNVMKEVILWKKKKTWGLSLKSHLKDFAQNFVTTVTHLESHAHTHTHTHTHTHHSVTGSIYIYVINMSNCNGWL